MQAYIITLHGYILHFPLSLITQNTENKPFGEITDSGTRGELQVSDYAYAAYRVSGCRQNERPTAGVFRR